MNSTEVYNFIAQQYKVPINSELDYAYAQKIYNLMLLARESGLIVHANELGQLVIADKDLKTLVVGSTLG